MANPNIVDPRWNYDIAAVVGKQLEMTWQFFDEDDEIVALTGYTAQGTVFDEDGTTVITLSPTVTAATGIVSLDQSLSALLTAGRLDYELDLVDSGGNVRPTFYGRLFLSKKPHH